MLLSTAIPRGLRSSERLKSPNWPPGGMGWPASVGPLRIHRSPSQSAGLTWGAQSGPIIPGSRDRLTTQAGITCSVL